MALDPATGDEIWRYDGEGPGTARVAEGEVWTHPAPAGDGWLVEGEETLHWLRARTATATAGG